MFIRKVPKGEPPCHLVLELALDFCAEVAVLKLLMTRVKGNLCKGSLTGHSQEIRDSKVIHRLDFRG